MNLQDFPRPSNDTALGLHWGPNEYYVGGEMGRWLAEMRDMHMTWCTTMNKDHDSFARFKAYGIQPVFRKQNRCTDLYIDDGGVQAMLAAGVGPYAQIYNEPELSVEWEGGTPDMATWINRWIDGADHVHAVGGYPGVQCLDPDWLRALLQAVKDRGQSYLFERIWFSCHNYGSNHPPVYPYDSLNPGKTIDEDWFAFLAPVMWDHVFRQEIGKSVPIICGEGGWCIGDNADNRYPKVGYAEHRAFHLAAAEMFRSGIMPNGQPLIDAWFGCTFWIIASLDMRGPWEFEENAWYSGQLSGTKQQTIDAIKAMPPYIRRFSWDAGQTPDPVDPAPVDPPEEEPGMPEFKYAFADLAKRAPKTIGQPLHDQIDVVPGRLSMQMSTKGLLVYQDGDAKFFKQAYPPIPKA